MMKVTITGLNHEGEGIARIDGKVIFVRNALEGENVLIEITKEHKKYNEAKVIKYLTISPKRIEPICPYYNVCGGCDLMHMSYEDEIEFKKEKVKNILEKYADVKIEPKIVKSDKRENYRNKITLHKGFDKPGYVKRNSSEVIDIDECKLASPFINNYLQNNNVNEDIVIRSNDNGEVIFTSDKTIIMNINNLKYQIDINSFFQVNNYITSKVFEHIIKFINEEDVVLDLYSGVGTLSIMASTKAKYVYGIEVNEFSYKNALDNIILNKVSNAQFLCGKVEDKIDLIKENITTIITDPPRSGMDKYTISVIKEKKPKKVIYMSCDPITLARDLKLMSDIYEIKSITLFDMFPCTKHIESVVILNYKNN